MTIYAYRCRSCGRKQDGLSRDLTMPCPCGGVLRRDFHFQLGSTGLKPHFNHAVGKYVRNDREFNDALKRRAEENSIATGITHEYSRLDPGDAPSPRDATEAIEARNKVLRDNPHINPATLTE